MNRKQKTAERRAKREAIKNRRLIKAAVIEDEDEELDQENAFASDEEMEDVRPIENEKVIKKDDTFYSSDVPVQPAPAPTSFDELDAMRLAEEKAQAVREVTCDVRYLVNNILGDETLDAGEKATAISGVADEFANRINTEMDSPSGDDADLLQLEALIAKDQRDTSIAEYIQDTLSKAILTTKKRNALPDSAFALVVTRDGNKIRKYPIHDKAHVRAALRYAAKQISTGAGAADARAAMPKIHAAAKKLGIGADIKKDRSAILVQKGLDGEWRWVGWASNNYLDRQGHIITKEAHEEYVRWWEDHKEVSPLFMSWHTPGTQRESPVDFMMFEKGFLIVSGVLTELEASNLLRIQKDYDVGMSLGAIGWCKSNADWVFDKYRAYEFSDLPLDNAANPYTDFVTLIKEDEMADKHDYLAKLIGKERADDILTKTAEKQEALDKAGVLSKENQPAPVATEQPVPTASPVAATPVAPAAKPAEANQLPEMVLAQLEKALDLPGLNAFVAQAKLDHEKVGQLEALVKELQKSQDDKLAETLTPPLSAKTWAWSPEARPSQAAQTLVKEDDPLANRQPGVPNGYWLSEATNTAPIKEG